MRRRRVKIGGPGHHHELANAPSQPPLAGSSVLMRRALSTGGAPLASVPRLLVLLRLPPEALPFRLLDEPPSPPGFGTPGASGGRSPDAERRPDEGRVAPLPDRCRSPPCRDVGRCSDDCFAGPSDTSPAKPQSWRNESLTGSGVPPCEREPPSCFSDLRFAPIGGVLDSFFRRFSFFSLRRAFSAFSSSLSCRCGLPPSFVLPPVASGRPPPKVGRFKSTNSFLGLMFGKVHRSSVGSHVDRSHIFEISFDGRIISTTCSSSLSSRFCSRTLFMSISFSLSKSAVRSSISLLVSASLRSMRLR
mmetsp:Transcript_27270/g.56060  ORF Transcript_27270/g.56060 Transcript_27270/m.56060 type:complete len:304 (+) Transcript_27270:156-1067(+)